MPPIDQMLTRSQGYVGLILLGALGLLLFVRARAELVALLVLIALEIPGILTRDEALSGFSNSAVISIIGLFVLSAALEQTGVADQMGEMLVRLGGASERRLILLVMTTTAGLSLAMNNIAAGAVVLPAAMTAARRARVAPGRLLMPLAFGAALGGMATIFTTANILMSGTLRSAGYEALTFLDFFPLGSLLLIAGIAYVVLLGPRLLPGMSDSDQAADIPALSEIYELRERMWEVQIPAASALVGQSLASADLSDVLGVTVVAVFHGQDAQLTPGPDTLLDGGDVLLVAGREEQVRQLPGVTIGRETRATGYFTNPLVQTAEVVIAPRASIRGRTLKELEFRRRYGVTVVAIWHGGRSYRTHIGDIQLQAGDALLVVGAPDRLVQLKADPALIMVTPIGAPPRRPGADKRWLAIGITVFVLGLATARWLPTSIAVLLGVVLLVITRCLTMDEAIAAIEWKTIFVIAGMLPLSQAMMKTGLAAVVGDVVVQTIGGYGFYALAAGLYVATMLLTQVLGGQVTALVMAPIAVAAAASSHVSTHTIGVIVAMACSASFLTPLAHPVNLLMVGPGGYQYRDFARLGGGLVVVCLVVTLAGALLLAS